MEKQIEYKDKFCYACGRGLIRSAVVCPGCGTPAVASIEDPNATGGFVPVQLEGNEIEPKSKSVAVVLAIFFGYWTYLYTYRLNAGKFWWYFSITVVLVVLTITIPNLSPLFASTILIVSAVIVILDTAMTPAEFFRRYPSLSRWL